MITTIAVGIAVLAAIVIIVCAVREWRRSQDEIYMCTALVDLLAERLEFYRAQYAQRAIAPLADKPRMIVALGEIRNLLYRDGINAPAKRRLLICVTNNNKGLWKKFDVYDHSRRDLLIRVEREIASLAEENASPV